ncbi:hypothetical protein [Streptomyces sp. NBC_00094]|uniref:hypothetical protein n=1 Tax=Streptomyces sp. NBC_00094 TaxID=2903620 RepID=UPI00225B5C9F|nr:hypothetical protein [Streptomyces sp. NBC_00094]MCX5392211.1 hypothetical protein [Streptomyces sp. NBC_00094]
MTIPSEPVVPAQPAATSRLAFAAAIALIVVTLAAFWTWRWWDGKQEGEFAADPKPFCSLVTPETIHRLVPESYGGREDVASCTWSAPREKGKYRANVHLFASRLNVELAEEDMREQRADGELGWEKGTQEDLLGLGDEAFLRFSPPVPGKNITAQVVFRRSNVMIYLAYARSDDDRAAARAGAVDAAREAAALLKP